MDLVEFAFCVLGKLLAGATHIFQDVSFKWCEERCRMVLQIEGKLGRIDNGLEKSMLTVSKELEAKDLAELTEQLRHLAGSTDSVESAEFSDLADSVDSAHLVGLAHSAHSAPSAHSVVSSDSGGSADSAELIMLQLQKVDASRGMLLSKVAFHRTKIAQFLSEKLSGQSPHIGNLPITFRVDPSSLKFREYLDSGGSSMVAKYAWLGESVAVKSVRNSGLTWQKFEEEAAVLAVVQHPNVVRLIGCGFIDKINTGQLVMELMDQDLRTVIDSRCEELGPGLSPFMTNVAIDIILQIAQAMRHLKDHRVLHRDLKSSNILVNIYKPLNPSGVLNTGFLRRSDVSNILSDMQEEYAVKIADFGLAECRPHSFGEHTRVGGTTRWRAPEVSHTQDLEVTQEYEWSADVYSFAMTCYEILTGKLPFSNLSNHEIPEIVIAGKRPEGLDELEIPDLLKELVKKCWATNPDERPTFEEIIKSLWECRVEAIVPVFEHLVTSSGVSRPMVLDNTTFEECGRENLIGDKLVIDLTQDLLGVSSSSYVIRTSCSDGQPCALKGIDVVDGNRSDFARLNHPHVVEVIDLWIEEKYLFLIMELMDGDLAKLIARTKKASASPFPLHVTVDLMLQIAEGMLHLHEMGLSHPHLKCENVLYRAIIKTEAYQVGDVLVKLGGFGWSRPADTISRNQDVLCFGRTCFEILTGLTWSDVVAMSSIPETTPVVLKDCIVSWCLDKHTTFVDVVKVLVKAKSFILQNCKDEIMYSNESNQTKCMPIKTDGGLEEIFVVHQLYPQSSDISTSLRATLVFFHGFHKVPEEWRRTWMTRDNKLVWPQKWLPEDLGAGSIRVFSVSFDANSNVSNNYNRYEMGKNLVQELILSPKWKLGEIGEAIILVGHSFGGMLVKSLVTEARSFISKRVQNNIDEEVLKCEKFLERTSTIVFYSVPHAPMGLEFENYISECRKIVALQRSSFLHSLREDSRFVADMNQLSADFASAVSEKVKILAFLEGKPMRKKCVLVTEKSFEGLSPSWECHKIDKDNHFEVCRPDTKNHIGYKILLDHIQLSKNASGSVPEHPSSDNEFLRSMKLSGPLGSYHRGTAVRMLTDYRSDLTTLNISLDVNLQNRVEEYRAFLKELTDANQREPNSPLTWQERNKLSLMLKDYQNALSEALEDEDDDEEDVRGVLDVEFKVEEDVADEVPLTLNVAKFSSGRYMESLASALDLCERHVHEFKKLLPNVSAFHQQCKNLVETLEPTAESNFERCHRVLDTLERLEVDGSRVLSSSGHYGVRICFESLVVLAQQFQMVVDLLRKCTSENLHKIALQLADLPSPPLLPKRWSEFSLAIRNCEWIMDLVEFAFYTLEKLLAGRIHIFQDVSFKWSEEKGRMVLQIQGMVRRLGSRLEKPMLEDRKELEKEDMNNLLEQLHRLGELVDSGLKWKLSGIFSRAAYNKAHVAHFLSRKLFGSIPHARYLPWTFRVDYSTLKFEEYLDSGSAGMVGKYKWFGENVAMKNVRYPGLNQMKFEEEYAILAMVQHPNVVRLIGYGFIDKKPGTGMLIMELMDHDLHTVIETRLQERRGSGSSPFTISVAIDIIMQIAQAMKHLRDHRVLHRDLKAKNVLVNIIKPLNSGGEPTESSVCHLDVSHVLPCIQDNYVIKLADFGLAKCRPHSSWVRTRMAGSTRWRALEVFHAHETEVTPDYKWPADVYSFAMTCYEILTGNLPFVNVPNQ